MRNTFIKTTLVFVLIAFGIYACEQPTSNLDQKEQKEEAIPEMNQVIDDHYIVIFADRDSKGKILAPDAESVKKLRSQVLNDSKIDIKSIDNE